MKVQENENIDSNAGALALFLTANGKNNNDVEDRDKWLSDDGKNYATFSKMFWTAGASGWSVDSNGESYLKLSGSSTATIDFYPFSNISNHGFTLEFDFSVENLSNLDAIVMDCYSGGTGFRVYGDKINFYQGGETVRCDFPTGQKIKVNLIVTSPDESTGQGFY
jgi:hypothetical protein